MQGDVPVCKYQQDTSTHTHTIAHVLYTHVFYGTLIICKTAAGRQDGGTDRIEQSLAKCYNFV